MADSAPKPRTVATDSETNALTDCVFFLKGMCKNVRNYEVFVFLLIILKKGDTCEFRHVESAKYNPECRFWLKGTCKDPFCEYYHPTIKPKVCVKESDET